MYEVVGVGIERIARVLSPLRFAYKLYLPKKELIAIIL